MAPRNVGINSTFDQQRVIINEIAVDVDNLSNAGFLISSNLIGYATEGYVNSSIVGFITSGSLSGYATQGYVNNSIVGFITSGALSGYATQGYVNNAVVGFITSGALTGYATQGYVNNAVVGFVTSGIVVGYATQGYVNNAVVGFITSGALSGYATEVYVTNSLVGYATQGYVDTQIGIRTFSGNYNDLTNKPFIPVNINDLADVNAGGPSTGQVLKWSGSEWQAASDSTASGAGIGLSDLSVTIASPGISSLTYNNITGVFLFTPTDLTGYATTSSIVGFVTTGALSGYATQGYVNNAVVGFVTSGIVVGYATEGYVNNSLVGYATQGYVNNAVVGFITSGASGSNLTGIVTYITAGSGISVNQNTGNVTITVTSSPYSTTSGIATYSVSAGISTSAGTATTATYLADAANILTGTINKDRISTTNSLTVVGDLYVSNNISFGGTTTQLNTQQLQIADSDIVLGIGTTFNSTDNTANHGGIAIASTEGTPLVDLNIVPEETNPSTYKKMMWFKGSSIGAGLTDAWLFNYAVGIGSTQVPNGVRLAAGAVQFTQNDLAVVRNINASGIVTASSFSGNSTSATYAITSGISTSVIGGISSVTQLQVTGVSTFTNGPVLIGSGTSTGTASQRLQVTGGAYVSGNIGVGVTNPASRLDVYSPTSGSTAIRAISGPSYSTNLYPGVISGLSTNAASAYSAQFVAAGVGFTSGEIGVYSFYPTFANFPADSGPRRAVDLVGGFSTGVWGTEYFAINVGKDGSANDVATLTNERFRVSGNGNVGIATANPSTRLHVIGDSTVSGVTNLNQITETVVNTFTTTLAPSTGTLTVDTSLGTVVLGDLNASVTTWAFTNVPTANSKATTITLIIDGDTAQTYGDACNVNGSAVSGGVKWSGGSAPTATNNFDIITFTIVKDSAGTINVFGSGNTNFS